MRGAGDQPGLPATGRKKKVARAAAEPIGWTGWRGSRRNGEAPWLPNRLQKTPQILWRAALNEPALAGLAATATHVLVADRELEDKFDVFRCLDAASGKELWAYRYPAIGALDYGNSPRATPQIEGNQVLFQGAMGHLTCVELATGLPLWETNLRTNFGDTGELPWGVCGSPLVVDGKVIVAAGSQDAFLVALDLATGEVLWRSPGSSSSYGSFIAGKLGGKMQIVGHDQRTLGGWDIATGRRLWTLGPDSDESFFVPTPIVHEGRLIVADEASGTRVYAFNEDGEIVSQPLAAFKQLDPDTHTPVVAAGRLFGVDQRLYCLDLKQPLKQVFVGNHAAFRRHTSLIASPDRLLICGEAGELVLIDATADQFRVLRECRVFPDDAGLLSHPALVGSRLYVRGSREIVCVDLSELATESH